MEIGFIVINKKLVNMRLIKLKIIGELHRHSIPTEIVGYR